jgi:hypothetical protein
MIPETLPTGRPVDDIVWKTVVDSCLEAVPREESGLVFHFSVMVVVTKFPWS